MNSQESDQDEAVCGSFVKVVTVKVFCATCSRQVSCGHMHRCHCMWCIILTARCTRTIKSARSQTALTFARPSSSSMIAEKVPLLSNA